MLDISKRYGTMTGVSSVRQKLIEFRPDVLEEVEKDAARCGRSANKQIEAILMTYYGIGDVNIREIPRVRGSLHGEPAITVDETDTKLGGTMAERRGRRVSKRSPQTPKGKAKKQ